jgi:hypothetical protein
MLRVSNRTTKDYFSEEDCEMIRDTWKQRALLLYIVLSFSSIRIFNIFDILT